MTNKTDIPTKSPYKKLRDGLAIRKVPQSKNWGVYLKLEGQKPLQFSLKTPDIIEAETKAWEEYTLQKIALKNGETYRQPKKRLNLHQIIDELISEYLKLQATASEIKHARKGQEKYSTEIRHWKRIKAFYDSKMRPNQLITREVRDYFLNIEAPSDTQLGRIKFCFNNIFERALEHNLIKSDQIVDFKKIKIEKRLIEQRDAFTSNEFHKLTFYAMTEFKTTGKGIFHNKMCIFYVGFMYFSGLRPGEEIMGLTWSDLHINNHGDLYCVVKKGKTENSSKRNRKVILDNSAHGNLLFVAKLKHQKHIKGMSDEDTLLHLAEKFPDEYIFRKKSPINLPIKPTDKPIYKPDYRSTFNQWLDELREIGAISKTKNFVLYSLRHSYITNLIEKNIPLTLIAENAGTSVKMIEKHYCHTSVMSEASRKYLVSEKLITINNDKPKEQSPEEIQTQKNELLDFVAKEFPV